MVSSRNCRNICDKEAFPMLELFSFIGNLNFFLFRRTRLWYEYEKSLLLTEIPFQSIKLFILQLLITQSPNLTVTKSSAVILNFIILICQDWHLISALLTCARSLEGYWWFPLQNVLPEEWINKYVHIWQGQRQCSHNGLLVPNLDRWG